MPLLPILIVLLACQALPWPEPLFGGGAAAALFWTAGFTSIPVLFSAIVSVFIVRTLHRDPYLRPAMVRLYGRARLFGFLLNTLALAGSLGIGGWGWFVWEGPFQITVSGGRSVLAPFAELLVPAPFILSTLWGWFCYYAVERSLRQTSLTPMPEPFFGRMAYLMFQFRIYALLVLAPAGLNALQQSFARLSPEWANHPLAVVVELLGVFLLFLVLPLAVPMLLGLQALPPGPLRDRLQRVAERCGFRARGIMLWPTRDTVANAVVLGLIPQARFVAFTDKLLNTLDPPEIDAVFGHEIGHAHHGHMPYYALFLVLSGIVATALTIVGIDTLTTFGLSIPERVQPWLMPLPLIVLGAYLFVVFGYLSRMCERQADLFGCRAVSCGNPHCEGHDETTVYEPSTGRLCPTSVRTFTTALERVTGANAMEPLRLAGLAGVLAWLWAWIRAWQHGPVASRVGFLFRALDEPDLAVRFQRFSVMVRIAMIVVLVLAAIALTATIGWQRLLN